MKKLVPILLVGLLVINGFGALAVSVQKTHHVQPETINNTLAIDATSLRISASGEKYLEITLVGTDAVLMNPGQPMIPRFIQTYELPFGATDIKVTAEAAETQELRINKKIVPSSAPLPPA